MSRLISSPASILFALAAASLLSLRSAQAKPAAETVVRFKADILPILEAKCFGCHGYGSSEGQIAFDNLESDAAIINVQLWHRVLKNVRAGIMPPADEERMTAEELETLEHWIKFDAFGIDAADPDPGRVTLRRLNRNEYSHTIRDLMGYEFRADENFPPDDTGHGFDNIADLLSLSPMLIEKYMRAADQIVYGAVPEVSKVVARKVLLGSDFVRAGGGPDRDDDRVSFARAGRYPLSVRIDEPGEYRVTVEFGVYGQFDYDRGRANISFSSEGGQLYKETHVWQDEKNGLIVKFDFRRNWQPGEQEFVFEVEPLPMPENDEEAAWSDGAGASAEVATNAAPVPGGRDPAATQTDLRIIGVTVEGPLDRERWVNPPNYTRFFPLPEPPRDADERAEYARQVLRRFTDRAYRRPVDEPTLQRLVGIAEAVYSVPARTFEQGIQQAMIAVLCSKRFLFRIEQPAEGQTGRPFELLDEYSLASRLSYLLWCSMPDDELFDLAERGELRKSLQSQVVRMLADPKSDAFVESFVGQWLRTREVDTVDVDSRVVLARDAGTEAELRAMQEALRAAIVDKQSEKEEAQAPATTQANTQDDNRVPKRSEGRRGKGSPFRALFTPSRVQLDSELRRAMREETEQYFRYIAREDRSVLELIDSDYTFANERLANHYGIEGIRGSEMRKVVLPDNSPRGGILTHGSILTITSQSTRTSPVKRGLFVLDNLLGTPAPPAPPNVPALENVEQAFAGREPTLREALEMHRRDAVCASCHARMDPIGLAMENFNALGMWRSGERGQEIEVESQLLTGEELRGVNDLKKLLAGGRRSDFYRCLAEKLLIFAAGRGMEYYDVQAIDQIVERLERENGRFLALLFGVVESAPFQKQRSRVYQVAAAIGSP